MVKYIFSTLLFCISLTSFSANFVAGKDYEILSKTDTAIMVNGPVNVTEFFSFGCPWCYRLETPVNKWVAEHKTQITFKKIPVVFNKDWVFYAKAYYAAKALSMNATLDPALFKAILTDKLSLNSDKAMTDFFIKQGVNPATAKSAFGYSPSIDLSVKSGEALMARNHINAVPAFIINNQFKTDLQMAKTQERLFELLDFLIAQSKHQKI